MRFATTVVLSLLGAATLHAQAEIRGMVLELGPGTGLADVEVTLRPVTVVAQGITTRTFARQITTRTDARGSFLFRPEATGTFTVGVKKDGFVPVNRDATGPLTLTTERPVQEVLFTLMNPGGLTGRFVDEQNQPIAGLRVFPQRVDGFPIRNLFTEEDGSFTVDKLPPGPYVVRATNSLDDVPTIIDYTEGEFQRAGRDFESLIWPTGVTDLRDALPLSVPPGLTASMGTIRLQQVERYRVHLNIRGDCSGSTWSFAVIHSGQQALEKDSTKQPFPCKNELLLTNLAPGNYEFAAWTEDGPRRWALAPFVVTRSNTTLDLSMNPGTDLTGRIVLSEGLKLPPLKDMFLMLRPDRLQLATQQGPRPEIQSDGTFAARDLPWTSYGVNLPRFPAPYYVREVRYAGLPLTRSHIDLIPGAQLEIELDDTPAAIRGTLVAGDKPFADLAIVVLAKLPFASGDSMTDGSGPYLFLARASNGAFQFTGIAPGEYRIAPVGMNLGFQPSGPQFEQQVLAGEKITLERGEQKTVQLKLPVR